MNEYEIDERIHLFQGHPILGPAAWLLGQYREWVNRNSDGWPYWSAATRQADSLIACVHVRYVSDNDTTEADVLAAVKPLQRFCTRCLRSKKTREGQPWPKFKTLAELVEVREHTATQLFFDLLYEVANSDPLWSFAEASAHLSAEEQHRRLSDPRTAGLPDPLKLRLRNYWRDIRNGHASLAHPRYVMPTPPKPKRQRKKVPV